ncbi:MAG: histidine-type phosphatase [Muribaculaceae bacterium]
MKKRINILIPLLLLAFQFSLVAQTTKNEVFETIEKAGGVYYAYPVTTVQNTPAPKGYEPFYISHYGRHGSRYLISDNDYQWVMTLMNDAHKCKTLTPLGEDVLLRLNELWKETEGRGGDLTPLGVRQHRGIAERMFNAYPQVFKGATKISARSTTVVRCVLSMDAFSERLKELNPSLSITRESSNRYMKYLNYHSPESNKFTAPDGAWREENRKFEIAHTNADRLVSSLFSDKKYITRNVNPHQLMWGIYWLAIDAQNVETPVSFLDLFEKQELFDLWQAFNYRFYVCDSNYEGNHGMMLDNAKPQLRNIIETAEEIIASNSNGATLRFGHDGNLIPLCGMLRLKDCYNSVSDPYEFYKHFSDFKIAPMAGNVQIVFFRNSKKEKDILVKFLHNERETSIPIVTQNFPFYKWKDVKEFYTQLLGNNF